MGAGVRLDAVLSHLLSTILSILVVLDQSLKQGYDRMWSQVTLKNKLATSWTGFANHSARSAAAFAARFFGLPSIPLHHCLDLRRQKRKRLLDQVIRDRPQLA